jgi:ATP-dependent RNA/DNA helicase IGHMBP2
MNDSTEYFSYLRLALQSELEEEQRQFEGFVSSKPAIERSKSGLTRFPLRLKEYGFHRAGIMYMELGSSYEGQVFPSPEYGGGFSGNKPVRVFSEDESVSMNGVLKFVNANEMKILFSTSDIPDALLSGKLGVDLRYDVKSYMDMLDAVDIVEKARNNRVAEIRDIILGNSRSMRSAFKSENMSFSFQGLNERQQESVIEIMAQDDVFFLHGPPGTGKTTTLISAIEEMAQLNYKVLVCASSNTAVDHITVGLMKAGVQLVRIGNPARVGDIAQSVTLDEQFKLHPYYKDLNQLYKDAEMLFRQAGVFKRQFNREQQLKRQELKKEARERLREADQLDTYITKWVLKNASVIATTLSGTSSSLLSDFKFDVLIVDEASQALSPAIWLAILRANKLILCGDPCQLPPTIKSEYAKNKLLPVLMEYCMEKLPSNTLMLEEQYRMHPEIMAFPSAYFYGNKLRASAGIMPLDERPIHFVDTSGSGWEEQVDPTSGSIQNTGEVLGIRYFYSHLTQAHPQASIAIISPYKAQVKQFIQEGFPAYTIDGFQGQERDIILISLVRSNVKGIVGFLSDERRLNVALTRAKKKLLLVGDASTLSNIEVFDHFFSHCEAIGAMDTVWNYPDLDLGK